MKKRLVAVALTSVFLQLLLVTGRTMAAVGNGTVGDLKAKFNEDQAQTRT
jgi:hypothetical protein